MLEDSILAAADDALVNLPATPTVAQIVVWRPRNPFHPKPKQLIVLIGPRIPSQSSRVLINPLSGEVTVCMITGR